ncbi:MAG TPA: hypothetical protein VGO97_02680 [Solirubrobacterales bacterium]|jgi:exopolyphosphatase/guanosine-5'-triphosphate,3'-diphosphate pyrophosphatase|nr:hypothetical protein [Solirubrobacterales bacterium]
MTPTVTSTAACIDIGTNTTRLLVAERDGAGIRPVISQRSHNCLGGAISVGGDIESEKIAQVAETVRQQAQSAREHGAIMIRAVATAAARDAGNRDELVRVIAERSGLTIDVLDTADEARLAFRGATRLLRPDHDGAVAVIDVGGGSSEIAVGTPAQGVHWSRSFRVGSGIVAKQFLDSDPPARVECDAARIHITAIFADCEFPTAERAIAIGNTSLSLARLTGAELGRAGLESVIDLLCAAPAAEVAVELGLDVERVHVLPAGIMVLQELSDRLGQPLRVGGGGVREGVLLELLDC